MRFVFGRESLLPSCLFRAQGTISAISVALVFAAGALVVFTGNLHLMWIVCLLMIFDVGAVVCYMVLKGMYLGAVEALSLSIVVGLSVDFALHTGHAYIHSEFRDRKGRSKQALEEVGASILGAANTTIGAMLALWFCQIYAFVVLGTVLLICVLWAIMATLISLSAFTAVAGPEGFSGDIAHVVKKCRKQDLGEDHSLVYQANKAEEQEDLNHLACSDKLCTCCINRCLRFCTCHACVIDDKDAAVVDAQDVDDSVAMSLARPKSTKVEPPPADSVAMVSLARPKSTKVEPPPADKKSIQKTMPAKAETKVNEPERDANGLFLDEPTPREALDGVFVSSIDLITVNTPEPEAAPRKKDKKKKNKTLKGESGLALRASDSDSDEDRKTATGRGSDYQLATAQSAAAMLAAVQNEERQKKKLKKDKKLKRDKTLKRSKSKVEGEFDGLIGPPSSSAVASPTSVRIPQDIEQSPAQVLRPPSLSIATPSHSSIQRLSHSEVHSSYAVNNSFPAPRDDDDYT